MTSPPSFGTVPPPPDPLRRRPKSDSAAAPILQTDRLTKLYPLPQGLFGKPRFVRAIEGVTLYVRRGETLGIIGESGAGKSTLAHALVRLTEPTFGRVYFSGKDLARLTPAELRAARRRMQVIFQNASSCLNPSMTVYELVVEGLVVHRLAKGQAERVARVAALLTEVHLDGNLMAH
jgi:oligopeptide transport system ATP-binding protein